ncbi:hypothetical protein [Flavivirga rizhaonensis]|uniref:Outer membrane protein beta-barrel domain-containing protein n=1 Tax=Flavivirga rizhaonensis TaxID=2559571 RepID=A0A4S1DUN2_9FLAO|nr:hypothetical protein [Flavivirga rizhaonensis]TGV01535.1 hypothetical protein EM932_14735 [Flavivirga rizhaonensis]
MKFLKAFLLLLLFCSLNSLNAQESDDYIEFNDRKNTVHGVYLGLSFNYGTIDKAETYSSSFKVAYVANQQFEIGFIGTGFYSDLNRLGLDARNKDLGGFYGGLHLEPILFSKSKVNLSFPLLIGAGAVALFEDNFDDDEEVIVDDDDWEHVFVVEPGINVLYNINRYIQLEAGIKYRLSSKVKFEPEYDLTRINGISGGMGIKIGVFNMGRNRYKKNIR